MSVATAVKKSLLLSENGLQTSCNSLVRLLLSICTLFYHFETPVQFYTRSKFFYVFSVKQKIENFDGESPEFLQGAAKVRGQTFFIKTSKIEE